MTLFDAILILFAGIAVGAVLGWYAARTRYSQRWARSMLEARSRIGVLKTVIAKERAAAAEKEALLKEVRSQMSDTFRSISANTLQESNRSFLDLAGATLSKYLESGKADLAAGGKAIEKVLEPVHQALGRYQEHLREVERSRENAYGGLKQQVATLTESQNRLKTETGNLVRALRAPQIKGRWGEMTLRRAVELSGMVNRCDFVEQKSATNEEGRLRPDMIVKLPGDRQIIVDAKVPLNAYLDSLEAGDDQEVASCLQHHARQVQAHILKLAAKSYWRQFQPSPDFVVLFIPGENFFSAALSQAPDLMELAARKGVVLATPSTLISLLKTISYGWRQETATQNAREILDLGRELYDRLNLLVRYLHNLGRDIDKVSATYNQAVGSFERRVLSSARKFTTLGIAPRKEDNLRQPPMLEESARAVTGDELHED